MTSGSIFSQAIEHIPALVLTWLTIYGMYWLTGIVAWPKPAWRERMLGRWGNLEIASLGGFGMRSLVLVSFISLFLELLLVRWIASEIRIFAYFKSLVLIACFLGFGLGCYLTRRAVSLLYTLVPLVGMVWLVELPWGPLRRLIANLSGFIGWFSDVHIWSRAYFAGSFLWGVISAGIALSILIPLFGLIAITFIPLGQLVGWYLEKAPKGILAYSINIIASLAGIWIYTLLCFLSTPPVVWFVFLSAVMLVYFWPLSKTRGILVWSSLAIAVLFTIGTLKTQWWGEESWKGSRPVIYQMNAGKVETYWSPYQKLTLIPLMKGNEAVRYVLNTNDSWYQEIMDLSASGVARHRELYDGPIPYHQYNLPYRFYPHPQKVLIAGAGMGNDVAAALRNGAGHVTAVEIDPLIYRQGKQMHFEHPYSSKRVEVHIDDARSFVQNTKGKFDLVVYSILDSHTTSSYYTNIRLDNYVYTLESMEATRRLLKPDGVFVMSFSSERPWFAGRLQDIVTRAFGKAPLMLKVPPYFFVADPGNRAAAAMAADPGFAQFVKEHGNVPVEQADLTTDDWPYLYQQSRGIPLIIWILSIGLTIVCWLTFHRLKKSGEGVQMHFFFLGAAFMLLEVQIISKAALLFGTTWLVNSIVITTLLLFILLSNLVISLFPSLPRQVAYAGLFVTMAVSYLVPANRLFFESALIRGAVATALYCSPVFFAGLIFIISFRQIGFRAEAFGSNLLGSLVGGLLESLSYLIGIKALVIAAALLYFLSLVTMGRVRLPQALQQRAVASR